MLLICYKKCSTCKKVEKIFQDKNIKYEYRNIDIDNPTKEEIKSWHEKTRLDIKKFFNTSGKIYRENNLKDKLKDMSLDDKYKLLSTDGLLVKRPILIKDDGEILVGKDVVKFAESK
ncbi:MAG: Spx/MgsR family RNA polymerase-binding regulatory protein [Peptoniphilaceae bacterium]|nr:Spx/MgsR family RNA polymerase-binding regulatory protein [Peptoniphilaceae bacterium]MDD7383294.1 Spx/MgsR family RNA polymerase-binding regulatory protein [Peptoniphilaceae bacterium]MDY3738335.1 Spx/MgsR family RNA polymerase-binding regulatory protein [Peptoniphilaceae bacterium]